MEVRPCAPELSLWIVPVWIGSGGLVPVKWMLSQQAEWDGVWMATSSLVMVAGRLVCSPSVYGD